jgi:3-dehydroquinate dehydratase-1
MKKLDRFSTSLTQPAVVGTIHSAASLAAALRTKAGQCDWMELRVDNFFPNAHELLRAGAKLPCPMIVTVRHASEGGAAAGMTARERQTLYREFLPIAGLVDIELRQAGPMAPILREAEAAGVGVILSCHDFRRTPSLEKLREMARKARDAGAQIFKVATVTKSAGDLAVLLDFLGNEIPGLALAAMGMGAFGKVSRLALARAGSCLNYGYLGEPNASGQWPVTLLKARIAEL